MRSSCSTLTRFIIGLLNLILGVTFLVLGVVGVLLRTNKEFLLKFTNSLSEKFLNEASQEQADEIAQFLLKYDVEIPAIFIVVGFAITGVCILGFIATCCSCNKLLQIYAVILTSIVVIQVIAVGVIFGVPDIYRSLAFQGMEKTLAYYDPSTPEGKGPARLWDLIMTANKETCCGMDGANDFKNTPFDPKCPKYCCKADKDCLITDALALTPPVEGCRGKIRRYADEYMLKILVILIIFIACQVVLSILTYVALTCKTASPI